MEYKMNTSKVYPDIPDHLLPGNPICEICGGIGWIRTEAPIWSEQFGKIWVCKCNKKFIQNPSGIPSEEIRRELWVVNTNRNYDV
jgi:hypothetical protein